MNAIIKLILSGLVFLSLALSTGCNSKRPVLTPSENPPTPPPELIITVQMVFDEAAKGVTNTDLDKLKSFYDQVIKDTDQANKLSVLKDTNKEYFIHKLLLLPATEVTKNILSHYTTHLSNAPNAINPSDANKQPLALLTDPARSVSGDQPIERQEMIKILADQGDATTIAAADADAVKMVLDAVLTKGDKNLMVKVLDGANVADPVIKTATFSWVFSKKADAIAGSADTVETAFLATINTKTVATIQDLVDEAAKGPIGPGGADLAKLAIIYNLTVKGDASGNKAAILAGTAASTATADRFPNYLANLAPDAGLLAIWTDYLTQINTHGVNGAAGTAAVSNQVLLPGVGTDPLKRVLSKPYSPARDQIIQEMISRNRASLAAIVDTADIAVFLTALRQEESQANFWLSFKALISNPTSAKRSAAATWASTNSAQTISKEAGTPAIATALAALIDLKMIVDDTANAATPIPVLKFLYDTKIAADVTGARAAQLALEAPTAGSADRFANFLAKRTPDADILAIWQNYLAIINTAGGAAAVTTQVNLVGAGVKPISSVLAQAVIPHGDQIVQEMVKRNRAGIAATVGVGDIDKFLTALRQEESKVDFSISFAIALATQKTTVLAWALTNKAQEIDKEAGKPSIKAFLTATPGLITPLIVVDQAEAAVASNAQLPLLKFLYEVGIKNDATGAKAALLAPQPSSAVPPVADRFANYLAKLDPDADLLAIWQDYLTQIATHAGAAHGAAEAAVTAQVNHLGTGGIKAITSVLGKADTADRNQIVKEMVSRNRAGIAATVGAVDLPNFLTALRQEETQADFLTCFTAALGPQKETCITWALANKDRKIGKEAGAPAVKVALAGVFTTQMVVDEAAKGAGANSGKLALLYESAVTVAADADALVKQAPTIGTTDRFANYLAKLTPDADILAIWTDYFTRINNHAGGGGGGAAAVSAQIKLVDSTGGASTPLNQVVAQANTPQRNKIIKLMFTQDNTVPSSVDPANLANFLDALLAEESQVNFANAFTALYADPTKKANALAWALANKAANVVSDGATIKAALAGIFNAQKVVDEAAKGAGANIVELKWLYDFVVNSPADAAALAAQAATAATGDRFANYLAKLAPNADLLAIWKGYLAKIDAHAGGGAAAVAAQVNLTGAGVKPITSVLGKANNANRNQIVQEMVSRNRAGIAASVDVANIENFLTALRQVESAANFTTAFTALADPADPAKQIAAFDWAMANRTKEINSSGTPNEVLTAVRDSARVTTQTLKAEVVASARNWKKVLFYVQVLAHDNNSAKNVADIKTGSKLKDVILLNKLIVAKSQTVESVQALKHYLSFLTAAEWQSIRDNITGKIKKTPATMITDGTHPDNADLGTAAPHPIKDALLIFQDNTGVPQPNRPAADLIIDQAP